MSKFFIGAAIAGLFFATSCNKDNMDPGDPITPVKLANKVAGTYNGNITNTATNQTKPATVTVTAVNDSVVSIHCVADGFEQTHTLRLYDNNDKVMVCYTGQEFEGEYGHHLDDETDFCNNQPDGWENDWCMNNNCWYQGDDSNAWTNHMNTQHDQNDVHYGDFEPGNNACNYDFKVVDGNSTYFQSFTGTKN